MGNAIQGAARVDNNNTTTSIVDDENNLSLTSLSPEATDTAAVALLPVTTSSGSQQESQPSSPTSSSRRHNLHRRSSYTQNTSTTLSGGAAHSINQPLDGGILSASAIPTTGSGDDENDDPPEDGVVMDVAHLVDDDEAGHEKTEFVMIPLVTATTNEGGDDSGCISASTAAAIAASLDEDASLTLSRQHHVLGENVAATTGNSYSSRSTSPSRTPPKDGKLLGAFTSSSSRSPSRVMRPPPPTNRSLPASPMTRLFQRKPSLVGDNNANNNTQTVSPITSGGSVASGLKSIYMLAEQGNEKSNHLLSSTGTALEQTSGFSFTSFGSSVVFPLPQPQQQPSNGTVNNTSLTSGEFAQFDGPEEGCHLNDADAVANPLLFSKPTPPHAHAAQWQLDTMPPSGDVMSLSSSSMDTGLDGDEW